MATRLEKAVRAWVAHPRSTKARRAVEAELAAIDEARAKQSTARSLLVRRALSFKHFPPGTMIRDKWGQEALVVAIQADHILTRRYTTIERLFWKEPAAQWSPQVFAAYLFSRIPLRKEHITAAQKHEDLRALIPRQGRHR